MSFYFFTDLDLINSSNLAGTGQINSNSFAATDNIGGYDRFLLSSVFTSSNSNSNPKAYAITDGQVAAIIHSNNNFVTLILKPNVQPGNLKHVALPKIKYYVYRGILPGSIFNQALDEINTTLNEIDLRDLILNSYPDFVNNTIAPPADSVKAIMETGPEFDTLIEKSFLKKNTGVSAYPLVKAGMSLGEFDPAGFSFEIVLEDMGYEPTLQLGNTSDPIRHYTSVSTALTGFESLDAKEEVLHYFDPCMLFGGFLSNHSSIKAKTSTPTVIQFNSESDYYNQLLLKFFNQSKLILDIRNEYNNSFNYYKFTADNYFSIYTDDVFLKFESTGGNNSATKNYYSNGWPLLLLSNDSIQNDFHAIQGNKTILNIEFNKGNNLNPLAYISRGFLTNGNVNGNFRNKEAIGKKRFFDLTASLTNSGFYGTLKLEVPNGVKLSSSEIKVIPTYIRIKYFRGIKEDILYDSGASILTAAVPASDEVQFLDGLFEPEKMTFIEPYVVGKSRIRVFEDERYLNLKQPHNSGTESVVNIGIAEDDNNITLFAYAFAKRKHGTKKINKVFSFIGKEENGNTPFIAEVDKNYHISQLARESLYFTSLSYPEVETVSFDDKGIVGFLSRFVDPAPSDFLAVIIDKNNYNNLLQSIQGYSSSIKGKQLIITGRNERDGNLFTDHDEASIVNASNLDRAIRKKDINFFSSELSINKFDTSSNTRSVVSANIKVFAKVDDGGGEIKNVFKDEDASVGITPSDTFCCDCDVEFNIPVCSRPATVNNGLEIEMDQPLTGDYRITNSIISVDAPPLVRNGTLPSPPFTNLKIFSKQILGKLYQQDLLYFIKECTNCAFYVTPRVNPTSIDNPLAIRRYESFLIYQYAASLFIDPLNITVSSIDLSYLSLVQAPNIVSVILPNNYPNIALNVDVSQNLVRPSTLFEIPIVVDFSVYMAYCKSVRDLKVIWNYFNAAFQNAVFSGGLTDHVDNRSNNQSFKNIRSGDNYALKYFNPALKIIRDECRLFNDLLLVLESHGLRCPADNTATFHSVQNFKDYIDILDPKKSTDGSQSGLINKVYKAINNNPPDLTPAQLKTIIEALNAAKNKYVIQLSKCIFEKLTGLKDCCLEIYLVGVFHQFGSTFLNKISDQDKNLGNFFYTPKDLSVTTITSVNGIARDASGGLDTIIPFTPDLSANPVQDNFLHIYILGLDDERQYLEPVNERSFGGPSNPPTVQNNGFFTTTQTSTFSLDTFNATIIDAGVTKQIPNSPLEILAYPHGTGPLPFGAGGGNIDQSNTTNPYITPVTANTPALPIGWGIKRGQSVSWMDGSNRIGTYIDRTKEIWLSNNVTQIVVTSESITDDKTKFDNHVVVLVKYCRPHTPSPPPGNSIYFFEAEDLFADDKFLLTQTKKDSLFKATDEPFECFLYDLVKDVNNPPCVQINMIGGFIGESLLPEAYDPAENYFIGSFVIKNGKVYKATSAISTPEAFDINHWTLSTYTINQAYNPGDCIWFADHIYKSTGTFTGGGTPDPADGNANWKHVCEVFVPGNPNNVGKVCLIGDDVGGSNEIYSCVTSNNDAAFIAEKWFLLPSVQSDPQYAFTGTNYTPQTYETVQNPAHAPFTNDLLNREYSRLRYSFISILFDPNGGCITINVQSYASPLRSRLDVNLHDQPNQPTKKSLVDPFTIYGQYLINDPSNANTINAKENIGSNTNPSYIPSYNQVLTALRCYGLLEGVMEEFQLYADTINGGNTDTVVRDWITSIMNAASVPTTVNAPNVNANLLFFSDYNNIKSGENP